MRKATIFVRDTVAFVIDLSSAEEATSLGRRMSLGGFIVATDSLYGKKRTVVINARDVAAIEIVEEVCDGQ